MKKCVSCEKMCFHLTHDEVMVVDELIISQEEADTSFSYQLNEEEEIGVMQEDSDSDDEA